MEKDTNNKISESIKALEDSGFLDGLTKMNDDNSIISLFKANEPQIINEVDKAKNKKIIDKWNRTGLLDSLNTEQRIIMAIAFEELARQLTSPFFNNRGFHCIETISFPIVRRILSKDNNHTKINSDNVMLFIKKLLIDLKDSLHTYEETTYELSKIGVDLELEFCASFSERYQLSENY